MALALAGPAAASTLGISLSWVNAQGGTSTWTHSQSGTPSGSGPEETFVGQRVTGGWTLGWDVTADADPFVNGFFSIQNSSATTQTYSFTVTLPVSPPVTPISTLGGSIGVTVTDANGNGVATVSSAGAGYVFNAANDGTTTLQLLGPGFALNAPYAGGSATASASAGLPGATIASIAANGTISITHTFTLTPGDSVGLTSFYQVVAVPEPSRLALAATGAVGLFALGRRRAP
jgi:hypothetical protein